MTDRNKHAMAASKSSTNTSKQDTKQQQEELLFLVARFLDSQGPACAKTAAALKTDIAEHALLGSVTSWHGVERPATLTDWTQRLRTLSSTHLAHASCRSGVPLLCDDDNISSGTSSRNQRASPSDQHQTNISAASARIELQRKSISTSVEAIRSRSELAKITRGNIHGSTGITVRRAADLRMRISQLEKQRTMTRLSALHASVFFKDREAESTGRGTKNIAHVLSAVQLGDRSARLRHLPVHLQRKSVKNYQLQHKVLGHQKSTYCVAVTRDGRLAATGSDDTLIKVWNVHTFILQRTLRGHPKELCDIKIASDDRTMASACTKSIRLWNIDTGAPLAVFSRHRKTICMLGFDPMTSFLLSSSDDGTCVMWDCRSVLLGPRRGGRDGPDIDNSEDDVAAAQNAPNNANQTNILAGLPLQPPQVVQNGVSGPQPPIRNPANQVLDSVTSRNMPLPIALPHIDANTREILEVNFMTVHPQGGLIVTGANDGIGRVWSTATTLDPSRRTRTTMSGPSLLHGDYIDGADRLVSMLRGHNDAIIGVWWSHAGDRVLSMSRDGTARVWCWAKEPVTPGTKRGDPGFPDMFANSHQVVLQVGVDPSAMMARMAGGGGRGGRGGGRGGRGGGPGQGRGAPPGRSTNRGNLPTLESAAFSADDRVVITMQCTKPKTTQLQLEGYWDNQIKVWDARTGQLQHIMRGHRTQGCLICQHPTLPHVVVTGANDGLICVWDVQRGELLSKTVMVAPDGASTVLDCQFIPEGTGPSTLIGVDNIGRVLMLGDVAEDIFAGAPPSQFTTLDYAPLIRDAYDNVLDQASQLPPHFFALPLCDAHGVVYDVQPTRTQDFRSSLGKSGYGDIQSKWAQWMRGQVANFHARVEMCVPLWVDIRVCEENARRHFATMVQQQDTAIEEAKLFDIEMALKQQQHIEDLRVQRNSTRGGGGTTAGGMLGAAVYHGGAAGTPRDSVAHAAGAEAAAERAAARARTARSAALGSAAASWAVSAPRVHDGNGGRTAGLLACERDILEVTDESDEDADADSGGSERGGRRSATLANLGNNHGRSRRKAAQQARRRVRRYTDYEMGNGPRAGSSSTSTATTRGRTAARTSSSGARSRSSSRGDWDMDDPDELAEDGTFVSGSEEEEDTSEDEESLSSFSEDDKPGGGGRPARRRTVTAAMAARARVRNAAAREAVRAREREAARARAAGEVEQQQGEQQLMQQVEQQPQEKEEEEEEAGYTIPAARSARQQANDEAMKRVAMAKRAEALEANALKRERKEAKRAAKAKDRATELHEQRPNNAVNVTVKDINDDETQEIDTAKALRERLQHSFSRDWLLKPKPPGPGGSFVPQLGDFVVYCVQGHREYLKYNPSTQAPPWQAVPGWNMYQWPMVVCRVDKLEFVFPPTHLQQHIGQEEYIQCKCELSVQAVPVVSTDEEQSGGGEWDRDRVDQLTGSKSFTLMYQKHTFQEFLIERKRFDASLKRKYLEGDSIHVPFDGGEDESGEPLTEFYSGKIREVSRANENFDTSAWEGIVVKWDEDDSPESRVSPWEVSESRDPTRTSRNDCWGASPVMAPAAQMRQLSARLKDTLTDNYAVFENFIDPVPIDLVPDYGAMVPLPMHFDLVMHRVGSSYYRQPDALVADLQLICSNCHIFNVDGSNIAKQANEMLARCCLTMLDLKDEGRLPMSDALQDLLHKLAASVPGLETKIKQEQQKQNMILSIGDSSVAATGDGSQVGEEQGLSLDRTKVEDAVRQVIEVLEHNDTQMVFCAPVDEQEVPGYHAAISHPMDIGTVSQRLNSGQYWFSSTKGKGKARNTPKGQQLGIEACVNGLTKVAQDLSLVFCNAMKFNLEGSPIWEMARALLQQAHDEMYQMVQQQLLTPQSGDDKKMAADIVGALQAGLHAHPPSASARGSTKRSQSRRYGGEECVVENRANGGSRRQPQSQRKRGRNSRARYDDDDEEEEEEVAEESEGSAYSDTNPTGGKRRASTLRVNGPQRSTRSRRG